MDGLAATLWEENADWADRILAHPFVQGLGNGRLPRASFQTYIAQDAWFLESFARAYARALADSPDRHGLRTFAGLIAGVLKELELHAKYAADWGADLGAARPGPATLAYTRFLDQTARAGDPGLTCAAMTPCMRLYAWLGRRLKEVHPGATHAYAHWMETYADPGFDALAGELESLLNRYASPSPDISSAYRKAMELEWGFFDAQTGPRLL